MIYHYKTNIEYKHPDEIDIFYSKISQYLSRLQYNKIIKYWYVMLKLEDEHRQYYWNKHGEDGWLENETISVYEQIRKDAITLENIIEKCEYFQNEYNIYIKRIGFSFDDETMDKKLYDLINYGIIEN
jgi:hypothetical protein